MGELVRAYVSKSLLKELLREKIRLTELQKRKPRSRRRKVGFYHASNSLVRKLKCR